MAKIPRVEHFLFCYPLRSGILFVSSVAVLFHFVQLLCLAFTYDTAMVHLSYRGGGGDSLTRAAGFGLVAGLSSMTLHTLLIIGVLYKQPGFFIPWLAVSGFSLIGVALGLILVAILMPIFLPEMPALTAGMFFLVFFIMGWSLHLFCVVHTYYRQLKEPKETNSHLNTGKPVNTHLDVGNPVKIPYNQMA